MPELRAATVEIVLDARLFDGLVSLQTPMSDESASAPETSSPSTAPSVPRVRRISNPKPKKSAKSAPSKKIVGLPVTDEPIETPFSPAADSEIEDTEITPPSTTDAEWPEPEEASTGGTQSQAETAKRKRRRRKGKGQSINPQSGAGLQDEGQSASTPEGKSQEISQERLRPAPGAQPLHQQQPPQHQPRPKVDAEHLTKMAWKIYLAEVSEEGVALIGDNDAKDLSRRCFRLAEIFIEEQLRRR